MHPALWALGFGAIGVALSKMGGGRSPLPLAPPGPEWSPVLDPEKVPIFDGMPTNIMAPPGYGLVSVWVSDDTGTYPDPRRFVQFHQAADISEAHRNAFGDNYFIGVVEGEDLSFYVLAKPLTAGCCKKIECITGKSWHTWDEDNLSMGAETGYMATEQGGTVTAMQGKLGPEWDCRCATPMAECFTALPRPYIDWPHIQTGPTDPDDGPQVG